MENLLRRIARDVNARQARADNRKEGNGRDSMRHDSRYSFRETNSRNAHRCGTDQPNTISEGGQRQTSQGSTRRSRWSAPSERYDRSREEQGTSTQMGGGGRGGKEREKPTTAAVSPADANPFTESMWEDVSCRQVLQAMFFAPDSAVPAGSTEEYKELEGKEGKDGTSHTPYVRTKPATASRGTYGSPA